jgi:hypothetical protein
MILLIGKDIDFMVLTEHARFVDQLAKAVNRGRKNGTARSRQVSQLYPGNTAEAVQNRCLHCPEMLACYLCPFVGSDERKGLWIQRSRPLEKHRQLVVRLRMRKLLFQLGIYHIKSLEPN